MVSRHVLGSLSVISKSVVTQNLVILLTSLFRSVCGLCVAPCGDKHVVHLGWLGEPVEDFCTRRLIILQLLYST
jgi:hypothetical protein